MPGLRKSFAPSMGGLMVCALLCGMTPAAQAAQIYRLVATNIAIDNPSPLFTSDTVTGSLSLADTVAPGSGFGIFDILDFHFNFGGIAVTLADTMSPGGDITVFGQRSASGASLSFMDMRFDLPSAQADCSLICAGQIQIGTFDQSNFVAIDDPDAATTSLLTFDAALLVPEPAPVALFASALVAMAVLRRRRKAGAGGPLAIRSTGSPR